MFLDVLRRRNPALIEAAIRLHQEGRIPANSTVVDLDTVAANAALIKTAADRAGLKCFAMTKQMGRNGDFCRAVRAGGIDEAVAVDVECARACTAAGLGLGHVGHLVQVPRAAAAAVAAMRPRYWTAFNTAKAAEAAEAASARGATQGLLARIFADGDRFYAGHEGGFPAETVADVADALDRMPGGRFTGLTTFPALLFAHETGDVRPTSNLTTLAHAVEALARAGRTDIEVNAPGTTSSTLLQALADHGATQCEPGHGLTGTTPLHAIRDLPERPAAVYVSEVSHLHDDRAYCFGGGLYIDPVFPPYQVRAIVSHEPSTAEDAIYDVEIPPPAAIDYYGVIATVRDRRPDIGDTVVFGFRQQSFFRRPFTVGIAGLHAGTPQAGAVHDSFGRPVTWPDGRP